MFPPKILNLPRKKVKSVHARNSAHPKIENWYSFFFDFDMSWNSITKKHVASKYMQISVIFCILKYSKNSLSTILEKHCANSHTINVPNRPQLIYRVISKLVNSLSWHFFWSGFSIQLSGKLSLPFQNFNSHWIISMVVNTKRKSGTHNFTHQDMMSICV